MSSLKETRRLLRVVHDLRTQCPWDRKQTHRSLAPHLLEEAYEVLEAIENGSPIQLKEELGDLLLQIALHAELSNERKHFNFDEVARVISDKMIRRHPHIYQKKRIRNIKAHMRVWTRMKSQEKPKNHLLEGIPKALPGLQLSQRYGDIASTVGFDWKRPEDVLLKVHEEFGELEKEIISRRKTKSRISMELGDIFFSLSNLARHLRVDAERAAKLSALKFAKRLTRMEDLKRREGKALSDCSPMELEKAWEKAKRHR